MAEKLFPYQNNFNGGEVSDRFESRTDIDKYYSTIRSLINFLPLPQGGATRRPGSNHALSAFCTTGTRIIPFKFTRDVDVNFIIHLCNLTLDVTDDAGVDVGV